MRGVITKTEAGGQLARPKRAHIFERDLHGHYVEPQWCATRLFETESFGPPGGRVLDPACGWGRILRAAVTAGFAAIGSDIVDRIDRDLLGRVPFSVCDFLISSPVASVPSIVCNLPFHLMQEFCERALEVATFKVAMLCPLRRLPAAHWLQRMPLETIYLLTPRPSIPPGTWIAAGNKPSGGSQEFCWLVFNKHVTATVQRQRWLHREQRE